MTDRLSWAVLALVSLSACGDDTGPSGPVPCGETVCSTRQVCDEAAAPPRCECAPAYTGADCADCAPGYEAVEGVCRAEEINCLRDPCDNGECIRDPGGDYCECSLGYAGPTCAQCADGYQDHDADGTCTESCALVGADLGCVPPEECNDRLGTAECGCPGLRSGSDCQACVPNHYRLGDGPCLPSCDAIECGDDLHCLDDRESGARCVCDAGREGDDCSECAAGFVLEAGVCTRPVPDGQLLGIAEFEGAPTIAAIDLSTGEVIALRSLPKPDGLLGWDGLLRDAASGRTFVAYSYEPLSGGSSLALDELEAGEVRRRSGNTTFPIVLSPAGPTAYSFYYEEIRVAWTDAASSPPDVMTTIPMRSNVEGLAWDPAAGEAQVITWHTDLGWSLYRVDLESGATTTLIEGADVEPEIAELRPQDLALFAGQTWTLAQRSLSAEERASSYCRGVATAFGYADADAAVVTPPIGDAGASFEPTGSDFELRTQLASGPEILVFDERALADPTVARRLEVHTTNPDAFLCIRSPGGDLDLHFASGASTRGYVDARGNLATYTVDVDGAFEVRSPSLVLWVLDTYWDSTFAAHDDLFRQLSDDERDSRPLDDGARFEQSLARLDGGTRWVRVTALSHRVYALEDGDF